jgi:Transposase C of IS166 homeodomain
MAICRTRCTLRSYMQLGRKSEKLAQQIEQLELRLEELQVDYNSYFRATRQPPKNRRHAFIELPGAKNRWTLSEVRWLFPATASYCSLAYSAFASLSNGRSGSASFQAARKFW